MNPEGYHYCGYIYNDNYLCVSDENNSCIRIWDLVNKIIYKEIKYDGRYGREIIGWNNKYTIVGCKGGFVIINIEEGKMIKKIKLDNIYVCGVKKMKLNKLGECLFIADNKSNIKSCLHLTYHKCGQKHMKWRIFYENCCSTWNKTRNNQTFCCNNKM